MGNFLHEMVKAVNTFNSYLPLLLFLPMKMTTQTLFVH